jgi:ribosome recycling factor
MIQQIIQQHKENFDKIIDHLHHDLAGFRTGRASTALLSGVMVDAYGVSTPLQQIDAYGQKMGIKELANISIEDVKTVKIEPWDQSVSKSIEKAITNSNLGLSVAPFEKGLRIIFPDLTAERREQFAKVVRSKLEEARISLRGLRDKTWKEIEEKEKSGGMGEDDKFRLKEELQKMIDAANQALENLASKKEAEIKNG